MTTCVFSSFHLPSSLFIGPSDSAAECVGELEGIQDLLTAVRNFSDNSEVCAACLGALWNLTVNGDCLLMLEQN